jgi:hypothetical protein
MSKYTLVDLIKATSIFLVFVSGVCVICYFLRDTRTVEERNADTARYEVEQRMEMLKEEKRVQGRAELKRLDAEIQAQKTPQVQVEEVRAKEASNHYTTGDGIAAAATAYALYKFFR